MHSPVKKESMRDAGLVLLLAVLAFLFSMQCSVHLWKNGNVSPDSAVYKTVAFYIDQGYMPYKDTFDHKGPLLYIYNWLGMQISYWRGIWVIEFLSLLCTFGILYKTARLCCGRLLSCFTLLAEAVLLSEYFEGGNMVEEYALPFIAAALYIFLDYFLNQVVCRGRLLVCGLSFGAVCLLRINMISIWIVFCIAVFADAVCHKKYREIRYFIAYFVVGAGIICIPILAWLVVNGAFEDFIADYFLFNFSYSSNSVRANGLNKWKTFLFYLNEPFLLTAVSCTAYLCVVRKKLLDYAYGMGILISLILISISGKSYGHYGITLVPLLGYPFGVIGRMIENELKRGSSWIVAGLLILMSVSVFPAWLEITGCAVESYIQRDMQFEETDIRNKIINVVAENTTEDDFITVYGNMDVIYARSRRLSASKYSYQDPIGGINSAVYDEYFAELEETSPKLIIITPYEEYELERIRAYIDRHGYQLIATFDETVKEKQKVYWVYGREDG